MKKYQKSLIVAVFLVVIVGGFIVKTYYNAGEFKKIKPHFHGQCRAVQGVLSSEDITIHPQTGVALISSDDRRPLFHGDKGQQGAIYAYDLTSQHPRLVNLTENFDQEFHPHGIGLYIAPDGNWSLFVVNHREDGHFVEIFDYKENQLVHRESISGLLMHSPNDVVPVGDETFYVTNDHGNSSGFGRTVEEYLQLSRSYVLYYDGDSFRLVAEGLAYANGINVSHDGKIIYVAATIGKKIYSYDRDIESGDLEFRQAIELGTGVDNFELDDQGNLWIGAHPKLLTFVRYAKDPDVPSPSQVLKVTFQETDQYKVDEVYLTKGKPLSGSSVAAVFQNILLIGSVFDHRFLVCKLP